MRIRFFATAAMVLSTSAAWAHGEGAVFSLAASIVSLIACLVVVALVVAKTRRMWASCVALLVSAAVEYFLGSIPFRGNAVAVTLAGVSAPWLGVAVVIIIGRVFGSAFREA